MNNRLVAAIMPLVLSLTAVAVHAQDTTIIRAMHDELQRNTGALRLDTLAPPYFIAYEIDDAHSLSIQATLGALVDSSGSHTRNYNVTTRVGSAKFDNENFFTFGEGSGLVSSQGGEIRRSMIIMTKSAATSGSPPMPHIKPHWKIIRKRRRRSRTKPALLTPVDFTTAPAFVKYLPPRTVPFEPSKWAEIARALSAVFVQYKGIQSSRVAISLVNEEDYFVNSNGAETAKPGSYVHIGVTAMTQADDGMPLSDYVSFDVLEPDRCHPPTPCCARWIRWRKN